LYVILVILVITFISYIVFFLMPAGDPAIRFAGKSPTPALVHSIRKQFGLDHPWYVQYGIFVKHLFAGDQYGWPGFGFSFNTRSPVKEELFSRSWVTMQLAIGAAVVWLALGIPIGIVSALRRRTILDRAAMGFALFGVSAPVFWLGLMALWLFWQKLGWLPGTGYTPFTENPSMWFQQFLMPWVVLSLLFAAFYARMVRGNLLETMSEDYIRTARAKGLPERRVIFKHGLRASLTPVVTMFGMDFGLLLGGAIITETVFNIPGLGTWVVNAVNNTDLPVVMGVVVLAAFFVAFFNLVVDILYAYLDPRVRYA
jgi:peptide/nickel transport system permease protein